jgi:hypothetical protein
VTTAIIPGVPANGDQSELREAVRREGHNYIDRLGWAVFLQQSGSDGVIRSLRMCDACRSTYHDRETCHHPACHGFYAATTDHDVFDRLWHEHPEGNRLAVRTGQASGIFVVDFDLKHDAPTAHDHWSEIIGTPGAGSTSSTNSTNSTSGWSFPTTLCQTTKSGGFHLVYRLPTPDTIIRSRNAVTLPGVDIKAEGGLFVVDPSPGYNWRERILPAKAGENVITWANTASTHRNSRKTARASELVKRARRPLTTRLSPDGETIARMSTLGGVSVGERDQYVNMVVWLLRTHGHEWDDALEILHDEWAHMEHPDGDEFRWEWCLYKLERVWRDVQPDPVVARGVAWVKTTRRRMIVTHPGRRT